LAVQSITQSKRQSRLTLRRRAFRFLRNRIIGLQLFVYRRLLGMDIGNDVCISLRAKVDFTNPRGVHIGDGTYVTFDSVILSHDMSRLLHLNTYIGKNCFIGAKAIIMPGVRVGDSCIVGSGAVVTRDVASGSIVAGNPAQIVKTGIVTSKWGILKEASARGTAYTRESTDGKGE